MGNLVRVTSDERVDLSDFALIISTPVTEDARIGRQLFLDGDNTFVVSGLTVTNAGGGVARIAATGAVSFLNEVRDSADNYGFLSSENPLANIDLDLSGEANGNYDIWIRHLYDPSNPGNRVFWNATTTSEFTASIDTRQVPRMQGAFTAAGNPDPFTGAGMLIATVTIAAGAITGVTTSRDFYFDGAEIVGIAPAAYNAYTYQPRWGLGANDRNTDRSQFGVTDFYTFVHYVERQIQEILGSQLAGATTLAPGAGTGMRYWSAVANEVPSLADLLVEHYERGNALAGKHKNINIADPGPTLTFEDTTGGDDDARFSWLGSLEKMQLRNVTGGNVFTWFIPSGAGEPYLVVPGENAAGADMIGGEFANILFGDDDFPTGEDFRIRVEGNAAAASRTLQLFSGNGAGVQTLRGTVNGAGEYVAQTNVRCRGAGGAGEFQYVAAHTWTKTVSGAAFYPAEDNAAPGAVSHSETSRVAAGFTSKFRFDNAAASLFAVLDLGAILPAGVTVTDISLFISSGGANHTITANVFVFDVTDDPLDTFSNPASGAVTDTYNGVAGVQELDLSSINDVVGTDSMVLVVECVATAGATSYITGAVIDYQSSEVRM